VIASGPTLSSNVRAAWSAALRTASGVRRNRFVLVVFLDRICFEQAVARKQVCRQCVIRPTASEALGMSDATTLLTELLEREQLPASLLQTIESIYEPLAQLIASTLSSHTPFVVGICGPQGSGKSTLTAILSALLEARKLSVAAFSIDDLYLTREERSLLGENVHPLLRTRGVPGTHDVMLGMKVLDALAQAGSTALPSFDKASDERRAESTWRRVPTPVDVVLFEGWCVGAHPQFAVELETPINELEREEDPDGRWRGFVNDALDAHYRSLFARIDMLIYLQASSFDVVFDWRAEQEHKLRERTREAEKPGLKSGLMNEKQLRRFVAHFERLTRHMMREMPDRADVVIELDAARLPVRIDRR
jgi:D-glycerate 3-kinase